MLYFEFFKMEGYICCPKSTLFLGVFFFNRERMKMINVNSQLVEYNLKYLLRQGKRWDMKKKPLTQELD